jgi:AcrR family transcriptional regulator
VEGRIIAAARACCRQWGWAKTSLDDVARAAGMSRATVYRYFPGGRAELKQAVSRHDTIDFFSVLETEALAGADDLAGLMSAGLITAASLLRDDAELQRALTDEPGEILPALLFRGAGELLTLSRMFLVPHLERFVSTAEANRLAELMARLVLTHLLEPAAFIDLTEPDVVDRLVRTRLLAGIDDAEVLVAAGPPT